MSVFRVPASALVLCGLWAFAPILSASETATATAAEPQAEVDMRQRAELCFDRARAVLVGLESRASGLKLNEFVDSGLTTVGSKEWEALELGFRLDVPTDRKLKDYFIRCLDSTD